MGWAVRWIEWPKVERDSVILCILQYMRHRGAAPQWRSANGAKHQCILPPVCMRPSGDAPRPTRRWLRFSGASPLDCIHSFIHSFILKTYIAPLQETTTQRRKVEVYRWKYTLVLRPSGAAALWRIYGSIHNSYTIMLFKTAVHAYGLLYDSSCMCLLHEKSISWDKCALHQVSRPHTFSQPP